MVAPIRTPGNIIAMLNAEIVNALKVGGLREKLLATGVEPVRGGDSCSYGSYAQDDPCREHTHGLNVVFIEALKCEGIVISMNGRGRVFDNIFAERL